MLGEAESRGGKLTFIGVVAIIISLVVMTIHAGSVNATGEILSRSLQGTILDEEGLPIEGATVRIGLYNGSFRFVASGTTDEQGRYEIAYERELGDAVSAILDVRGNMIVYQVWEPTLDVRLPEVMSTLSGQLSYGDEYTTPVSDYPIRLIVNLGRGEGRITIGETRTDEDGRYALSLEPGQFQSIRGENTFSLIFNESMEEAVTMHSGDQRIMDRIVYDRPPMYFNGRLEVDVTDAVTGEPLENAVVALAGTDLPLYQAGHYFFSDILRGGPYTVSATAPGYEAVNEPIVVNGSVYPLSVQLRKTTVNNPPTVTATAERAPDRGEWYNRDVLVSFHAEDEEGELTIDPPVLVTTEGANQIITGSAVDAEGLIGTGSLQINLDKTAPTTIASASGETGDGNWYRSNVSVTLSWADDVSGVEKTMYSLDRGRTWRDYDGAIPFSREGEHRLYYRSVDIAGNTEAIQQHIVKIDKTPPMLLVLPNPPIITPASGLMKSIRANVVRADFYSGIESVQLTSITIHESGGDGTLPTADDIQNAELGTYDTDFDLRAEAPGVGLTRRYTITYTATDKAGNTTVAQTDVGVVKLWQWTW
ncbi:carboxypeptidase-like regulatory domain-containing protein [Paenibacillus sp. strain BS8-2]